MRLVVLILSNLMYCLKDRAGKASNSPKWIIFFILCKVLSAKLSPISGALSLSQPMWVPVFKAQMLFTHIRWWSSTAQPCAGWLSATPPSARATAALNSSLRCRALMALGCSNLCTSNIKSQLLSIPFSDTPLTKMETKDDHKAQERPLGLGCSEQPFPTLLENESQRGRETEITHSTIYCPKTASSTKGTTIIIGEKKHSPLTCESDLQHYSFPSTRALSSQERQARQLRAAAHGTTCRLQGCLTEREVFSPPLAWRCAATTFQNASL